MGALVMASLWRQNRRRLPELGYWLGDFILQFLSFLAVALRGILPDYISLLLGVPLSLSGTFLLYIGLARFVGIEPRIRLNAALLGAFVLLHAWFSYARPNLAARNIGYSLALASYCGQCAWLLLRRAAPARRRETRATAQVLSLYCLACLVRIVAILGSRRDGDFLKSGLFETAIILAFQILLIGLCFALFLMVNRRLGRILEAGAEERMRAEASLLESESRYRRLFENMVEGVAYCRMIYEGERPVDWVYLSVNAAFPRLTGLEDVEGRKVTELIPGIRESDPGLFEAYGRVASTGLPERIETYVTGLRDWFAVSAYCPEPGCFVAVFDVITERKEIEARLIGLNAELEARVELRAAQLADLYDNAPCGYHSLDAEGFFLRVNKTELSWLGYSEGEMVGKMRAQDILTPNSLEVFNRNFPLFKRRGWLRDLELEMRRKDGTILPVLLSATATFDDEGRFVMSRSSMIDNTERQRWEGELQRRLAEQASLVAVSACIAESLTVDDILARTIDKALRLLGIDTAAILLLDPGPDGQLRLAAQRNLGAESVRDIGGARLAEGPAGAVTRSGKPLALSRIEEFLVEGGGEIALGATGTGSAIGIPLVGSKGPIGAMCLSPVDPLFLDDQGQEVLMGIGRQIASGVERARLYESAQAELAERVKAEAQREAAFEAMLRATDRLEGVNRELEAFAYSVAHDLRAPLRSIDGFSRILEEDLGPALGDEGRRVVGIIRESVKKEDDLITGLLEITRIGRAEPALARVDMRAMALGAIDLVGALDAAKGFDFRVGELPFAEADPVLMGQVWGNLLSNAVKYSLPSASHRIEVGGREEGERNVYFVKDSGVGFDQRYSAKLFGMFQRLHSAKEFEGNGIGLAIVKRVVARHSGQVWAEGKPGAGATFYFSLPTRRPL
jgi:PAS domain S-box-containing protein